VCRREVVGGGAVVDEPAALFEERPPAPHVVPGIGGIHERYELEVRPVGERDEGVARQAVGVLAARGDPEA
jgi:hypothetical protein